MQHKPYSVLVTYDHQVEQLLMIDAESEESARAIAHDLLKEAYRNPRIIDVHEYTPSMLETPSELETPKVDPRKRFN